MFILVLRHRESEYALKLKRNFDKIYWISFLPWGELKGGVRLMEKIQEEFAPG